MLLNCGIGETLESPLDCKKFQPVHPKGDQSCMFIGRWSWNSNTLATWCKEQLILKDPDAGKDWRLEEKGATKDEMVGWHHWLNGHESEWTPGVGDGQGGLACCDSWGRKESDTTEWLIGSDLALITEEGFLISPCYSLELCIQMGLSFLFSFAFHFSSFLSYF